MIQRICSIYDSKAVAWHQPLFFPSNAAALRSFADAVNGDGEFARHAEDYTLFELGSWDPSTGAMLVGKTPVSIAVGINLKETK